MNWPAILYFGNDWSADNKTSSHHIARRLMRDTRVVYIECPGLRAPQGNTRDIKKIFSKIIKALKGPRALGTNAFVYTLLQIPFHRFGFIRNLNKVLIIFSLKQLMKQLKIDQPILWFVVPHLAMVLGELNERFVVYYCIDDYASLPGVNKTIIEEMDNRLTTRADIVFTASEPLKKQKESFGPKVVLSRHGVDFDHFNKIFRREVNAAPETAHLPKPVIGFFGLIESWVDLELIEYLARARPQWSFLMVGRLAVQPNPCEHLKNVHFIGSRPYDELPQYAAAFDVSIIPCKNSKLIFNFNPLKLREYLAMGKPVVSIYFPEIAEFTDVVEVAGNYEEFLKKIETALATDTPQKIQQRVDKVKPLSWDSRYRTVIEAVDTALLKVKNGK